MLWSLVLLLPCLCCHPQQARPAPRPVAARECPFREALWKVFCSLRAHSELLLSLHCDSCSWMIGTFLCSVTLQRDVSPCSLMYCCMYSTLGYILRVRIQRHLRNPSELTQSACAFSMAFALSVSCETTVACLVSNRFASPSSVVLSE